MRLFIDSAQPSDWRPWAERGLLYGVTTNPLIFERQAVPQEPQAQSALIDRARALGLREIQFQLTGLDFPEAAARRLTALHTHWPEGVVAKVPLTEQGLACLPHLDPVIPITFTAAYAPSQAVVAAARSARYIAPYYGRLLEAKQPADTIVEAMQAACQPSGTRVLVASLRNAAQVAHLAGRGFDTFTLSPKVFGELVENQLSNAAVVDFERAAKGP